MVKKASRLAVAFALFVAASLCFKPVRVWASVEGSYIYNQFVLQGPAYVFKSRVGGAQGIRISTGAYTGASQSGVPTAPTGTVDIIVEGGQTTAARTACAAGSEGRIFYDVTVHSIAFCDGTSYHKLVTGSGANDSWTSY